MSEDYGDYFAQNERVSEESGEHWRGVKSPDGGFHEVTPEPSTPEPEQVPVWVKVMKIDGNVLPIRVYMDEPPPVKFGYVFDVVGKYLFASAIWGVILATLYGALWLIFHLLFGN